MDCMSYYGPCDVVYKDNNDQISYYVPQNDDLLPDLKGFNAQQAIRDKEKI